MKGKGRNELPSIQEMKRIERTGKDGKGKDSRSVEAVRRVEPDRGVLREQKEQLDGVFRYSS